MFRNLMSSKKLSDVLVIGIVGVSALTVYAVLSSSTLGTPFPEEALFLDHYTIEYAAAKPDTADPLDREQRDRYCHFGQPHRWESVGGGRTSFQLNGPDVPPGAAHVVSLTVDTAGTGFYFVAGHSYAVTLTTARNTQVLFTVNYS